VLRSSASARFPFARARGTPRARDAPATSAGVVNSGPHFIGTPVSGRESRWGSAGLTRAFRTV
jgi:hypothetical protein